MKSRFEEFISEKQYLVNVSSATLSWYRCALNWLPSENPTQEELKDVVIRMRKKGLRPTGCNSFISALNTYLKWSGSSLKIGYLKEPQYVLDVFSADQIKRVTAWKPATFCQHRLKLIMLICFDVGARIDEVLSLRVSDCDMDNLLLTLTGKGSKQRRVPFSFELRRVLYKYIADYRRRSDALLLASRNETKLGRRVVLRDVKLRCKYLGFAPPRRTLHAMRHTFAVNYLRKGGSVFHLQKMLGHTSLDMTRRYAKLMTQDLSDVHQKLTLLAA